MTTGTARDTARAAAVVVMADNDYPGEPVRVTDTNYGDPCWLLKCAAGWAVLIYDDEPDCVVSAGNHPGRYQPTD